MNLLNWNTEWAVPGRVRGERVANIIAETEADVICLTEAYPGIFPEGGHVISSSEDTGYDLPGGRRKVLLWSREPWGDVYLGEDTQLPGGRLVVGVTGGVRVVGVCIPWKMAHVNTGSRDREPWEDHLSYLKHLGGILEDYMTGSVPLIVVGDWNQRIPKAQWQPNPVYEALMRAIPKKLKITTEGCFEEIEGQLIDHLAVNSAIDVGKFNFFGPKDADGQKLSDHVGYSAQFSLPDNS